MEQHHPVVEIGASRVKIAYSLGRGEEDNGWNCDKVCSDLCRDGLMVVWPCQLSQTRVVLSMWLSSTRSHLSEFDLTIDMAPKSPPKSMTQKAWIMNDGTSDIGETPAQFLLIRNLDTMLQEENIAKGLMKLESEPKRILLIRDRKTKVSWGYAFVEYRDVSVCPFCSWLTVVGSSRP